MQFLNVQYDRTVFFEGVFNQMEGMKYMPARVLLSSLRWYEHAGIDNSCSSLIHVHGLSSGHRGAQGKTRSTGQAVLCLCIKAQTYETLLRC